MADGRGAARARASSPREHAGKRSLCLIECLTLWLTGLLCTAGPAELERERAALLTAVQEVAGRLDHREQRDRAGHRPDRCAVSRRFQWRRRVSYTKTSPRSATGLRWWQQGCRMTLKGYPRDGGEAGWIPARPPDQSAMRAALARQDQLTKPRGALGRLEEVAIRLAAMQGRERPSVDQVHIAVFAADHGVASEGISAYPQSVTVEMLRQLLAWGAAISVLAQELSATLDSRGRRHGARSRPLPHVIAKRAGAGTSNLSREAAMSASQQAIALDAGYEAVERP